MANDYEFVLYFPKDRFHAVLDSIASRIVPSDKSVEITYRGTTKNLPVSSWSQSKQFNLDNDIAPIRLDTVLKFPTDEAIKEFISGRLNAGEPGETPIGYIYLYVELSGTSYYLGDCRSNLFFVSFDAASSSMSRLFKESTSIKKTMLELLAANAGICAFLGDGSYPKILEILSPAGSTEAELIKLINWSRI